MTAKFIVKNLTKTFQTGETSQLVLDDISLSIPQNKLTVITGSSGSGKSTLLSILSGLEAPDSGSITFNGIDICNISEKKLATLRNNHFGFIFQSAHFIPYKSLLDNVLLPFSYSDFTGSNFDFDRQKLKALALLKEIGLEQHKDKSPSLLSGGEQQRMAFVRALMLEPDVLFADEPTANLDFTNSELILGMLKEQVSKGKTVVMVSHDPMVSRYADVEMSLNIMDHKLV